MPSPSDQSTDRDLIDKAPIGIFEIDKNGQYIEVNTSACEMVGHSREELLNMSIADLDATRDDLERMAWFFELQKNGQTRTETVLLHKEGHEVDVMLDAVLIDNRIVTYLQDISERKQREQDLVTIKERMELALEGANLGIWDWNMQTGEMSRDELLTDMLGYTPSEMGDRLDDWTRLVHPDGEKRHDMALAEHIGNRTPYYQCEYRLKTKSGDWKWVRTMGKVVQWNETGEPVRAVGIHQDIDNRKRAELALEAERDLFKEGPSVVFEWEDTAGWPITYVSENVESVLGYAPDELRSDEFVFADIVHDDDLDRIEQAMTEHDDEGTDLFRPEPYRVITADGDVRWVMEYTRAPKEEGESANLHGYLVDITERRQRERELEAREEKYRNLFEDTRDALMLMDREGYLDCNERALELFGVESVEAFVECSPWELSPTTQPDGRDSKDTALERIDEAFEEGEAFFEWVHQRLDGTEFPAEVKLSRFEYDDQPVVHALVRDISERKAQKQALTAERNRIRAITNAIPDVAIVYDRQGRYREVLTGREDHLVADVSELVDSKVTDWLPHDAAQIIIEGIEKSLDTGTVQTVEYALDLGGEKKYFGGRIAPIAEAGPDEVVLLSREITERKEYERELKVREEKYRNLFEDTRDALMLLDRDGFFDCNEQTLDLFGVESVEEFVDYSPWELSPATQPDGSDSKEAALAYVETAFEEGEEFFEWIHQRLDGTEFPAEVKLSRFEHQGEPALHALVRNITERKEYERELEEQRNNLEVLNQVVRHDIRNKLQLVLAYAEMVRTDDEKVNGEYIERVLEAARDSVEITTTARDVTEVMLQSDVDLHAVPLHSVVEAEAEAVRSNYDQALVRIGGSLPSVEVLADDMLASVFRNVLTNAIQHNDKDRPEVTVSATRDGGSVLVRIADNGLGVPDERKERIFEQGEMGLDSDGSGLGLYLVDTLVGRYDGDVRVEDNDPTGAVFIVELPVAEDS